LDSAELENDPERSADEVAEEPEMTIGNLTPRERWADWLYERRINNVDYITSGTYTPADRDADMLTMVRFVFAQTTAWPDGYGLAIDMLHNNRVYFNPSLAVVGGLDFVEISAEFIEDDKERLIEAIEESGVRDWQPVYEWDASFGDGAGRWSLGIKFADGTIMRRTGWSADGGIRP
jgi:hypothetical protein